MLYAAIYVLINSDSFSFFFVIFTKSIIVSDGVIDLKKTYQRNLHCMFFIVFFLQLCVVAIFHFSILVELEVMVR